MALTGGTTLHGLLAMHRAESSEWGSAALSGNDISPCRTPCRSDQAL